MTAKILQIRDYQLKRAELPKVQPNYTSYNDAILDRLHGVPANVDRGGNGNEPGCSSAADYAPSEYWASEGDPA